jgi:hypothetical protein
MTISAPPLSDDARFQEAVARARVPRHDAERTVDGALDRDAFRHEVRAAIDWFKRMRDAWRSMRSTSAPQVERAPEGVDRMNGAERAHVEAPVTTAPATEAPRPTPSTSRVTTAIERAKESPERGLLAWLKRTWSRLTAGAWKSPFALCVAPLAAYLAMGGLVCMR